MIALATVLSGGETCADMALVGRSKEPFLREFLPLTHGIPSRDTFSRVFRLLDPGQFRASFLTFMRRFAESCQKSAARAAGTTAAGGTAGGAVIAIDGKSNEIKAVPALLGLLSLKGGTVTADALHCQRAIAQQVTEQGGHYVLALNGHQPALWEDVRLFLDDPRTPLARWTQATGAWRTVRRR